jgi:hypothetical protein
MAQWDFRGQYADEVQEILGAVYSENEFRMTTRQIANFNTAETSVRFADSGPPPRKLGAVGFNPFDLPGVLDRDEALVGRLQELDSRLRLVAPDHLRASVVATAADDDVEFGGKCDCVGENNARALWREIADETI